MPASQSQLKFFADFIEKQIGIIYSDTNYFQLEHRLNDIVVLLGYKDVSDLWGKAQSGIDGQLRDLILDLATNNETSFFRDAAVFSALTKAIVPQIKKENPNINKIRFWSAACSTGQEAYSIAISMEQARLEDPGFPDFEILLTDISDRVLNRAKEGLFSQLEAQRGMSARHLIQYFDKEGESNWRVKPLLRDKLSFKKVNLLEPFPPLGVFDVVFCRNVLIYQSVENKSSVVDKITKKIASRCFLILGSSESMLGVSNAFSQEHFENAVFYKKLE